MSIQSQTQNVIEEQQISSSLGENNNQYQSDFKKGVRKIEGCLADKQQYVESLVEVTRKMSKNIHKYLRSIESVNEQFAKSMQKHSKAIQMQINYQSGIDFLKVTSSFAGALYEFANKQYEVSHLNTVSLTKTLSDSSDLIHIQKKHIQERNSSMIKSINTVSQQFLKQQTRYYKACREIDGLITDQKNAQEDIRLFYNVAYNCKQNLKIQDAAKDAEKQQDKLQGLLEQGNQIIDILPSQAVDIFKYVKDLFKQNILRIIDSVVSVNSHQITILQVFDGFIAEKKLSDEITLLTEDDHSIIQDRLFRKNAETIPPGVNFIPIQTALERKEMLSENQIRMYPDSAQQYLEVFEQLLQERSTLLKNLKEYFNDLNECFSNLHGQIEQNCREMKKTLTSTKGDAMMELGYSIIKDIFDQNQSHIELTKTISQLSKNSVKIITTCIQEQQSHSVGFFNMTKKLFQDLIKCSDRAKWVNSASQFMEISIPSLREHEQKRLLLIKVQMIKLVKEISSFLEKSVKEQKLLEDIMVLRKNQIDEEVEKVFESQNRQYDHLILNVDRISYEFYPQLTSNNEIQRKLSDIAKTQLYTEIEEVLEKQPPEELNEMEDLSPQLGVSSKKEHTKFSILFGVNENEQPIESYICAFSDKILLQGNMYIFSDRIGFHSYFNCQSFVGNTSLSIPYQDIIRVDKRKNALIFDNSLAVVTSRGELFFTSYVQRDNCIKLLNYLRDGHTSSPAINSTQNSSKKQNPFLQLDPVIQNNEQTAQLDLQIANQIQPQLKQQASTEKKDEYTFNQENIQLENVNHTETLLKSPLLTITSQLKTIDANEIISEGNISNDEQIHPLTQQEEIKSEFQSQVQVNNMIQSLQNNTAETSSTTAETSQTTTQTSLTTAQTSLTTAQTSSTNIKTSPSTSLTSSTNVQTSPTTVQNIETIKENITTAVTTAAKVTVTTPETSETTKAIITTPEITKTIITTETPATSETTAITSHITEIPFTLVNTPSQKNSIVAEQFDEGWIDERRSIYLSKSLFLNTEKTQNFEMIIPQSQPREVFNIIFYDNPFEDEGKTYPHFLYYMAKECYKETDIVFEKFNPAPPEWFANLDCENSSSLQTSTNISHREYKLIHPIREKIPFGPKVSHCHAKETYFWISVSEFYLEREIFISKVPFSDCFTVRFQFHVEPTLKDSAKMTIKYYVNFSKSTAFKGRILSGTQSENNEGLSLHFQPQVLHALKAYSKKKQLQEAKISLQNVKENEQFENNIKQKDEEQSCTLTLEGNQTNISPQKHKQVHKVHHKIHHERQKQQNCSDQENVQVITQIEKSVSFDDERLKRFKVQSLFGKENKSINLVTTIPDILPREVFSLIFSDLPYKSSQNNNNIYENFMMYMMHEHQKYTDISFTQFLPIPPLWFVDPNLDEYPSLDTFEDYSLREHKLIPTELKNINLGLNNAHCEGKEKCYWIGPHEFYLEKEVFLNKLSNSEEFTVCYQYHVFSTVKTKQNHENSTTIIFKMYLNFIKNFSLKDKIELEFLSEGAEFWNDIFVPQVSLAASDYLKTRLRRPTVNLILQEKEKPKQKDKSVPPKKSQMEIIADQHAQLNSLHKINFENISSFSQKLSTLQSSIDKQKELFKNIILAIVILLIIKILHLFK